MLSKNEKGKVLKARSNRNGGKKSSQEDNTIQGEAAIMENGSLKLIFLRKKSVTRIGSCRILIMRLSLVHKKKSRTGRKRNMGIGSTLL